MRNLFLLSTVFLSGCGFFTTGEGTFNGRLVDVGWQGLIFKSCEAEFQFGENSSVRSSASTLDRVFCERLKEQIGQTLTVKYRTWAMPCCLTTDSKYEIYE